MKGGALGRKSKEGKKKLKRSDSLSSKELNRTLLQPDDTVSEARAMVANYKTTYLLMAFYVGSSYFWIIPCYSFITNDLGLESKYINYFQLSIWVSYTFKPNMGYLTDNFPIYERRLTPYIILSAIVNLAIFTYGYTTKITSWTVFLSLFVALFTIFTFVDSIARRLP